MAAKAEKTYTLSIQLAAIVERLRTVDNAGIGMKYAGESPGYNGSYIVNLRHGMSLSSWGEEITVTIVPVDAVNCNVTVHSKCTMPTQLIDWGKNGKIVDQVFQFIMGY